MLIKKWRIFTIKIVIIGIFILIIYRIFTIQILDIYGFNDNYRYRTKKTIIPAERGIIYDCNGFALTGNKKVFKLELCSAITSWSNKDSLSADEKIQLYKTISEIIAKNTENPANIYFQKILKFAPDYINGFEIVTNLTPIQKNDILSELKENKIRGIRSFKQPSKRVYPKKGLAGPLIGLYNSGKGECGIEQSFDAELTGIDGWAEIIQYGTGENYHFSDMEIKEPIAGHSIYLTIDAHIQAILESNLKKGIENYNAKNAIGIIISPKDGKILAMSGISADNLNASPQLIHSMPIFPISWLYEPGSTVKPITALLAIEKKLFESSDIIDCRTRKIGRRTISDVKPFKNLTFKEVITYSSTVGITYVVDKISDIDLYNRLVDFGFGHKTGIILNGERNGILRSPSNWSRYSRHSLSFGQELSVAPIQLIYAYGALANEGKLLQPLIINKIIDNDGKVVFNSRKKVVRYISNINALDTLITFLQAVVDIGYGGLTKLKDINIAGKTGTSEKHEKNGGGYEKDKYISSFVGFCPVEDPQIVMLIIYDEPDYNHRYGSISAVPTFKKILEEIVVLPNSNLLNIITQINQDYILVPNCIGLPINALNEFLHKKGISYSLYGDGEFVTNQFPKSGISMLEEYPIMVIADED
ncbi:MAG: hypothetical protein H8D22_05790 [Candidatus Cloacimonetes bacterium]|nr:hypothetical protein [Candidatus Cloacimonadota bacterium]